MKIEIDWKATLWTNLTAYCPICKKNIYGWYCPSCGLPKKNSKYAVSNYGSLQNCDHYHFRPEFNTFEDFQLCDNCYTTNPSNAKYCRNCGNKLQLSRGVAKNAHSWIDLGLSVLWATETIEGLHYWGDSTILNHSTNISEFEKNRQNKKNYIDSSESAGYDVATQMWGDRWRTPTKEEFEELTTNCKWEKYLDPKSKKHALKIIGPNGNSIIIPVTGFAGCNESVKESLDIAEIEISHAHPEAEYSVCALWTSSRDESKSDKAYAFYYTGYKGFTRTLTEIEKKEIEFKNARYKRKSDSFWSRQWETLEDTVKRTKEERAIKDREREILRSMGDDSKERAENIKKDNEKRLNLWLNTPVEIRVNECRLYKNTIRPCSINNGYAILPVADKKWIGKL